MKVEDFVAITKDLCGFPSFFNAPFFRRILAWQSSTTGSAAEEPVDGEAKVQRITKDTFQSYWMSAMAPFDPVERFFRVVRSCFLLSGAYWGNAADWDLWTATGEAAAERLHTAGRL